MKYEILFYESRCAAMMNRPRAGDIFVARGSWSKESGIMRRVIQVLTFLVLLCCGAPWTFAQDPFVAFQKKDYAAALDGFQTLAAQGNPNAMNNLGLMYANGLGVPRDDAVAVKWYGRAAGIGHIDAINNLGGMYEMGHGVPQNYAAAAEKYALAAKYGLSDAQYNLAALYESGNGVPNDALQAYIWYSLSAAQGDQDAAAGRDRMATRLDPTLRGQADTFVTAWKPGQN